MDGLRKNLMLKYEPVSMPSAKSNTAADRAKTMGKFLSLGGGKFWVRRVTYGTFAPEKDGNQYHNFEFVDRDLARIALNGFNTIRTYTVPPRWLLDAAHKHGLKVMVGLAWEQHITFLDSRDQTLSIEESVRAGVRACASH